MKSKFLVTFAILSILFFCTTTPLLAAGDSLLFGENEPQRLVVNNRILAKVNGKPISVVDVMKKMDVLFYREFPQYTSSIQARNQFYKVNWKHILEELVSKELVLADAEENKLPVTNGDVRQEMEQLFGPNIIGNLDKINLTYDEAQKIVQGDIIIRRMIAYKVNGKALRKVTPQVVRTAYDEFILKPENIKPDIWQYTVVSVRDNDATRGAEAANFVYELLNEKVPADELTQKVKENSLFEKTQVNVSEEYRLEEKDISKNYKEILAGMQPGTHSQPISQKSRSDNSTHLFRIFILKNMKKGGVPSFNEMENKIKDQLLDQAVAQETDLYIKKLRAHFDVQEDYLKNSDEKSFEPFSLK